MVWGTDERRDIILTPGSFETFLIPRVVSGGKNSTGSCFLRDANEELKWAEVRRYPLRPSSHASEPYLIRIGTG